MDEPKKYDDNTQQNNEGRDAHGRWLPGYVTNPAGRPPKGSAWKDIIDELLSATELKLIATFIDKDGQKKTATMDLGVGDQKTMRHAITMREIQRALAGDTTAIKDLLDRDIGKPAQSIDITSGGEAMNPANVFKFEIIDKAKPEEKPPDADTDKPQSSQVSTE